MFSIALTKAVGYYRSEKERSSISLGEEMLCVKIDTHVSHPFECRIDLLLPNVKGKPFMSEAFLQFVVRKEHFHRVSVVGKFANAPNNPFWNMKNMNCLSDQQHSYQRE